MTVYVDDMHTSPMGSYGYMKMGLTNDKKRSLAVAKQLFPAYASLFTSSKDGRAEAALIAYYGRQTLFGQKVAS